jgi:hypothetical protein
MRSNTISLLIATICCALISTNAHGSLEHYELPVFAFGVSNVQLNLDLEDQLTVPMLSQTALTDNVTRAIIPYGGSEEGDNLAKQILSQRSWNLGNVALYFYLAVNHAFDRIFRNLNLFDREISNTLNNTGNSELANLRDVLQVNQIKNGRLTLRVFYNKDSFDREASAIGLHTAQAFWSQNDQTIGIYFNPRLIRLMKTQAQTGNETNIEIATKLRDLIARRIIDLIAHELVHFIHAHNGINLPAFLSEVAAIFIQKNASQREELFQLAKIQTRANRPLFPWLRQCEGSSADRPPIAPLDAHQVKAAIDGQLSNPIDFENLLLMDVSEFYSQSAENLTREYDLATMFLRFLIKRERNDFISTLSEISSGAIAKEHKIERAFHAYLDDFTSAWFKRDLSSQLKAQLVDMADYCLTQGDFVSSYFGSWKLAVFESDEPRWIMWLGDIFFNGQRPYIAFDYFSLANSFLTEGSDSSIRVMATSRLGDAFELLGDAELARSKFKESASVDVSEMPFFAWLISARDKIKFAYYDMAINQNRAPLEVSPLLVETYIHELQGGGCSTSQQQKEVELIKNLAKAGKDTLAKQLMANQTETIIEKMRKELDGPKNWNSVLEVKIAKCTSAVQ